MSDIDDSVDTAQPSPDPLGDAMHRAYARGDKETAQRLMMQRDGQPVDDGEGQGAPEPVAPEVVEHGREALRELPGGEDLAREWGSDLGANLDYARVTVDHLRQHNPQLLEVLESVFEDDDTGESYRPGDDAGLVRLAAQFGRLLAHRDGTPVAPVSTSTRQPARGNKPTMSNNPGSTEQQISEITKQIHKALAQRDNAAARRLDRQREQLLQSQGGDQRIVGQGGRYA